MLIRTVLVACLLSAVSPSSGPELGQSQRNETTAFPAPRPAVTVAEYGALGDGHADDTGPIQRAINACPAGGIVDFGRNTYLVRGLKLRSHCTYQGNGAATLLVESRDVFAMDFHNVSDFTVDGITFRGAGLGGGHDLTITGVVIKNCRFKDIPASNRWPTNRALYSSRGPNNSRIENNHFQNGAVGIELYSVAHLTIAHNVADTLTGGDWLHITNFGGGDDVTISGNTLSNLDAMGIELQQGPWRRLSVTDNRILGWAVNHSTKTSWGISLAIVGAGARVQNNTITETAQGTGSEFAYGIEVGGDHSIIEGNSIRGFQIGIVVQGSPFATISNNHLIDQTGGGIMFSNAGAELETTVQGNIIENPKSYGILNNSTNWAGSVFINNRISRSGGRWAGDASTVFNGFATSALYANGPLTFTENEIEQTAASPPPGFSFRAIVVYGSYAGDRYEGNDLSSRSSAPFGYGFYSPQANSLHGAVLDRNSFHNLLEPFGGAATHAPGNLK
jgi:hypothetical protein